MIPQLPPEFLRFDSITEAHKTGNIEDLTNAVKANQANHKSLIRGLDEQRARYWPEYSAMNDYLWALEAATGPEPVADIYEARAAILSYYNAKISEQP
jgi:hypothetical protein